MDGKITFATLAEAPVNLREKKVTIDEWGGAVFSVREVTADKSEDILRIYADSKGVDGKALSNFESGIALLTITLFDEDGKNPPIEFLNKQPLRLVKRLIEITTELNSLSDAETEKLEKNLPPGDAPSSD